MMNHLTVAQNIYIGREPMSNGTFIKDNDMIKDAEKLFELIGIKIDPRTTLGSLTVGKQQMVEIAKAVSRDCKLLVLDEPTAGLDPESQAELYSAIASLNQNGTAIIMITHDTKRAVQEAKHILSLGNSGWFYGTADEYLGFGGAV